MEPALTTSKLTALLGPAFVAVAQISCGTLLDYGDGSVTCSPSISKFPVKGIHGTGITAAGSANWGCNADSSKSDFDINNHAGTSIFAREGTPILATTSGKLSTDITDEHGIRATIKDACGWNHKYSHLISLAQGVSDGAEVQAGDLIGFVGKTGYAANDISQLFYSISPEKPGLGYRTPVDPWPLLQPVELDVCSGYHTPQISGPNRFNIPYLDLDNDGKTDLLVRSPMAKGIFTDSFWIEKSNGAGFEGQEWKAEAAALMHLDPSANFDGFTGDFNNDKKTDVLVLSRNATGGWENWIAAELSAGTGFVSEQWPAELPRHLREGGSSATYWFLAGDFNGDGIRDIVSMSPDAGGIWKTQIPIELGTKTGFKSETWNAETPNRIRNAGSKGHFYCFAVDLNGDNKTDILTLSPDAEGWDKDVSVELSTGTGFISQTWSSDSPGIMRSAGFTSDYKFIVGKFSSTSKYDLAIFNYKAEAPFDTSFLIDQIAGSQFKTSVIPAQMPALMHSAYAANYQATFFYTNGDFNGDNRTDIAAISANAGNEWSDSVIVEYANAAGTGFDSTLVKSFIPQQMQDYGKDKWYFFTSGRFSGSKYSDLFVGSIMATGGWEDWAGVLVSRGSYFDSTIWPYSASMKMRLDYEQ